MKYLVLALLPLVMCAPEKRFILDTLGGSLFDMQMLKCDVQLMLDVIGADPTEAACEAECHKLLQEGHYLNYGCPLVCLGFQTLANNWHLVPEPADGSDPCGGLNKITTIVPV